MAGFQQLQAMDRSDPDESMACRGCAAKPAASPWPWPCPRQGSAPLPSIRRMPLNF